MERIPPPGSNSSLQLQYSRVILVASTPICQPKLMHLAEARLFTKFLAGASLLMSFYLGLELIYKADSNCKHSRRRHYFDQTPPASDAG